MEKSTFVNLMGILQRLFCAIDNDLLKFYWNCFKEFDDNRFEAIVNEVIKTYKYPKTFPPISFFNEIIKGGEIVPHYQMYKKIPLMIVDKKELPENGIPDEAMEKLPAKIRESLVMNRKEKCSI